MTQVVNSSWTPSCRLLFLLFILIPSNVEHMLFEIGGTILFSYYAQNYAGCWLELYFIGHALPEGLVVYIIRYFIGVA